ncbi:MAG TPA: hypothetical protein VFX16_27315 [Pseudonocardiaceae bacterium]|nr:hypothetical protein [Pseudonocardiaceae bacterium]
MILALLLRRLSPRARLITGAVLLIVGLVADAVSTLVSGLLIHALILTVLGAAMLVSGRRAQRATGTMGAATRGAEE